MRLYEIEQIANEGVNDPHIFKAVFMAGSPGSGKSTVARMLFGNSGLKSLNVDTFWSLYKKTAKVGDYDKFWKLYQNQEKTLLTGRLGLLIDGTAKNPVVIKSLKERLESMGYETIMVYVDVSLDTSMQRAEKRASDPTSPDYGRTIEPNFIKDAHGRLQLGVKQLRDIFNNNFFEVNNDAERPQIQAVERQIRRWLERPVRNDIAQSWMENERNRVRR